MDDWLERTALLIKEDGKDKLASGRVAVCGLGGVGCAAAEALARCGVGALTIVDCDEYEATNLNRQLFATLETLGERKASVGAKRLLTINPELKLNSLDMRICAGNIEAVFEEKTDFVIDAVDDVTAKLLIIEECERRGVKYISCMGTGNRLDATGFRFGAISDTAGCGCGLARVMRRELKKRGIEQAPVLYSLTKPAETGRTIGSISFVPPVAGFLLAQYAACELLK